MNFKCQFCSKEIKDSPLGTHHRNHCPFCLWSKHLDNIPGDRLSTCQSLMEPIALAFKKNRELMIVHHCTKCQAISTNRIAGDDDEQKIVEIFQNSQTLSPELTRAINSHSINLATTVDKEEILRQLFGNDYK